MKQRSSVLSAVALAVSAVLVTIGGAAHADDLFVDGDAIAVGTQADIEFGTVACGSTTTEQVAVYLKSNGHQGNSQQVFRNDTWVNVTAETTAPLSVTVTDGAAGDIEVPEDWEGTGVYKNNDLSPTGATATVTLTAGTTAGARIGTVTFSGSGTNWEGKPITVGPVSKTARWTVGPCATKTDTTTTLSCPDSVVYTGTALTPCTATLTSGGGASLSLPVSYTANTLAGTATATASFAGDATRNPSDASTTFQITKAPSTTTLDCPASVTYTGSPHTPCSASVVGVGGLAASTSPSYTDNIVAGTAQASASYPGDDNHSGSSATKSFAILPADATCTVIGYAGVYDGAAHGAEGSCTGLNDEDLRSGLSLGDAFIDVPGGTARWNFAFANYRAQSGTADIAIGPAASSITLICSDTVYDGTAKETCSATVTGGGGLDESVPVTYQKNTAAGEATASADYAGDRNHTSSTASTTFRIAKAPTTTTITCTAPNTYTGQPLTPCTARVVGAGGLDDAVTPTYENNIAAGPAARVSAAYPGGPNHEPSADATTFEIAKATSSIALACIGPVVFTGEPHTPCTAVVSGAGLAAFTVPVTYVDNVHAGDAGASASWVGDDNHVGTSVQGGFVIGKALSLVVVKCPTAKIPFSGSAIEPCTATVTGGGGLNQPLAVAYTGNTAVGLATATASFPGDADHLAGEGSATFEIEAWKLDGFYKPVDMGTTVLNVVKGGSTVPLKFAVRAGEAEVTSLTTLKAAFVVKGASCDPADAKSDDVLTTTGNTTLRYDATAHQWIQNWQTPKTPGKCYTVVLTTADGSTLSAQFQTK